MSKIPAHATAVPVATLVGAVPDRPCGVLYICRADTQIVARTLGDLRGFADACGWPVLQEVYDLAPPDVPRRRRIGWRTVEHLVLDGEVNAVIAPAEREIAWTHREQIALRAWLRGVSACALYPQHGALPAACDPMRPEGTTA
ncbi:hypothetical protein AB0Q95_37350 [Streptomyces sp. NPDC059900]|uniref:hypothetical protein n=1 Tax=Streptomyces sp. NPDC059900 TaxID=3155816 RepID=UPI00342A81EC